MINKNTKSGYIRLTEILKLLPVSRSTWWKKVASGEYPQSIKLSKGITVWLRSDIEELLESFLEKSNYSNEL